MHKLFNDGDRKSFDQFCAGWMYQALGWRAEQAVDWFEDAIKAYRKLPEHQRWPLPHEACTVTDYMSDGDWPAWPSQMMLDWIPRDIIDECGKVEDSRLNGPFLSLRADRIETVAARLNDAGFECRRSDELVELAAGYADPEWTDTHMRRVVETAEAELKKKLI